MHVVNTTSLIPFITLGRHSIDNRYANPYVLHIGRLSFNTFSAQCSLWIVFCSADFYLTTNDVNIVSNRFSFSFILCHHIRKLASSPKWAMKAFNFPTYFQHCLLRVGFDSTTTTTLNYGCAPSASHVVALKNATEDMCVQCTHRIACRHILTGVSRTSTWICPCFCFVHNNRINW